MAILNKVQGAFSSERYAHQHVIFRPRTINYTTSAAKLSDMKPDLLMDALDHCDAIARPGHSADFDAVRAYVLTM